MIKTKETSSVILLILVLCLKLVLNITSTCFGRKKIQFPRNLTRHKVNNALTRL